MIPRSTLSRILDELLGKSELNLDKSKRQEMKGTWIENTMKLMQQAQKNVSTPLVWALGQDNLNFWVGFLNVNSDAVFFCNRACISYRSLQSMGKLSKSTSLCVFCGLCPTHRRTNGGMTH